MSTNRDFDRIARAWLAEGPSEVADRVLDTALDEVHLTRQRRWFTAPWRFPQMLTLSRAGGLAALALVVAVGAGGLIYLNSKGPSGAGGAPTSPTVTQAPTTAPTVAPSFVAPGITGWTSYTSVVHGFTMGYPKDWSVNGSASREWRAGDLLFADTWPYADTFSSGSSDEIGLWAWDMPAAAGADLESVAGLTAWAETFCNDVVATACDTFTQAAVPMCLNAGGDSCRAALLVPTAEGPFAFFEDFADAMITGDPVDVRVVTVGREDSFPAAARYGGSVALLKSILTTLDVWAPGQQPAPEHWFTTPGG